MSVLRDYELWSLAKLNVELNVLKNYRYPARNANSLKGIFEMNFTHKIDMFNGRHGHNAPVFHPIDNTLLPSSATQ